MRLKAIDHPRRALTAALAAWPLLASCASATRRGQLSPGDQVLALRAAGIGLYELAAGQLAQARAQRADLQAFGRVLAEHHEAANAALLTLLQSRAIAPPPTMPAYLELRLARLRPDGGSRFDQRFVQVAGLQDQERLVALHEDAGVAAEDASLRSWFSGQLPALRSHLAVARSLAAAPPA